MAPKKRPTLKIVESKGNSPSPPKKGRILKLGSDLTGVPKFYNRKDVIITESTGPSGCLTVVRVVSERNHNIGSYNRPIVDYNNKPDKFKPEEFDVAQSTYLYVRDSEENNGKKLMGYKSSKGKEYHQLATVGWLNTLIYGDGLVKEKAFRDCCFDILVNSNNWDKAAEQYAPWDPVHSITKTPFRSLDQILTNEATAHILFMYFLPKGINEWEVYSYMKENNITNIFSKNADGRYCQLAIDRFGFPSHLAEEDTEEQKHNEN